MADEKLVQQLTKLVTKFEEHEKNWRTVAAESTDRDIRERSVARAETWDRAARELSEVLFDLGLGPCVHPGVHATPTAVAVFCWTCTRNVPVSEL